MPLLKGQIVRRDTSLGVHVRALHALLSESIATVAGGLPSERRVRLRGHLVALERAYPEFLVTDTDLAQAIAEDDGEEIEDGV